jgi:hypothetical protein
MIARVILRKSSVIYWWVRPNDVLQLTVRSVTPHPAPAAGEAGIEDT